MPELVEEESSKPSPSRPSLSNFEMGYDLADTIVDVDYDGPDDPTNPLNWSERYKWSMVTLLAMMSLASNLSTIMCAPANTLILSSFHSTDSLYATLLVSIWELGEAFGPLLIAPLSEMFGRVYIYNAANILFIVCSIIAAVSVNLDMLVAFRFFNGVGVACVVLNPSIIGDLFAQERRGKAMALINLPPLLGPVAGPVIGGYLARTKGWRWVFWFCTLITGVCECFFIAFFRETYKTTILQRKGEKSRSETGRDVRSKYDVKSKKALVRESLFRPIQMAVSSPIILCLAIYLAIVYGYIYIFFTTLAQVFESRYHFSQGPVGLTFLGIGVGIVFGVLLCGTTSDWYIKKKAVNGVMVPKHRLPPMLIGTFSLSAGLFMYGWSAEARVYWIVPIISTAFLGFGLVVTMIPTASYIVDAYSVHAASAMGAVVVLRCIAGATLPLLGPPLYKALGLGWGNSVLGFVALLSVPGVLAILRFG